MAFLEHFAAWWKKRVDIKILIEEVDFQEFLKCPISFK